MCPIVVYKEGAIANAIHTELPGVFVVLLESFARSSYLVSSACSDIAVYVADIKNCFHTISAAEL